MSDQHSVTDDEEFPSFGNFDLLDSEQNDPSASIDLFDLEQNSPMDLDTIASVESNSSSSHSESSVNEEEMLARLFGFDTTPENHRSRYNYTEEFYEGMESNAVVGIEQNAEASSEEQGNDSDMDEEDKATQKATMIKDLETQRVYHATHPSNEQRLQGAFEINKSDASWVVSSYRTLWGPDKLTDDNPLTYWQSSSNGPGHYHTINLSFLRAVYLTQVSLFVDYNQDESYTPRTIAIYAGISQRDYVEITQLECEPMCGWVNVDMTRNNDNRPFRAFVLRVEIQSTQQNGRDTHLRQMKVYAKPYHALFPKRGINRSSSDSRTKRRKADL